MLIKINIMVLTVVPIIYCSDIVILIFLNDYPLSAWSKSEGNCFCIAIWLICLSSLLGTESSIPNLHILKL